MIDLIRNIAKGLKSKNGTGRRNLYISKLNQPNLSKFLYDLAILEDYPRKKF
jgi:hypothetical protein